MAINYFYQMKENISRLLRITLLFTLMYCIQIYVAFSQPISTVGGTDSLRQEPGNTSTRNIKGILLTWQPGRLQQGTDCSLKPCDYISDGMSHKASCPSYSITITLKNTNSYKVAYILTGFDVEGTYRNNNSGTYTASQTGGGSGIGKTNGVLKRNQELTFTYNECGFSVPASSGLPQPASPRYASYQLKVEKYKKKSAKKPS